MKKLRHCHPMYASSVFTECWELATPLFRMWQKVSVRMRLEITPECGFVSHPRAVPGSSSHPDDAIPDHTRNLVNCFSSQVNSLSEYCHLWLWIGPNPVNKFINKQTNKHNVIATTQNFLGVLPTYQRPVPSVGKLHPPSHKCLRQRRNTT